MSHPSRNALLAQRSRAAVWHPATQMKTHETVPLLPVVRGEGSWLYDADGRRYLDGIASWWVNLFGHREPRIAAAIRDQLGRLEHVILAGFTHEPVIELSERLAALTQHTLGHAFYASDGASATEIALKMSAHHWRNVGQPAKNGFVCLEGGYHGETLGALGVTDVPLFRRAYEPLVRPAFCAPSPDARLAEPGESPASFVARRLGDLQTLLEDRAHVVAAVIVEPLIQCATGMAMHEPAYLASLRALCDRFGVHLIADEIAVGFGRTGTFFAHEQAGIRPDFLCLSKGITGGFLPLSVVLTTDTVYGAFYDDSAARGFLHSHSYTGNPLACSAALAVLDIFAADDVIARNRDTASRFDRLAAPLAADPRISHWRRCGMVWAFDVPAAPRGFARRFMQAALDQGVLLVPLGRTVYFMPPYILDDEQFAMLVRATHTALDKALSPP